MFLNTSLKKNKTNCLKKQLSSSRVCMIAYTSYYLSNVSWCDGLKNHQLIPD